MRTKVLRSALMNSRELHELHAQVIGQARCFLFLSHYFSLLETLVENKKEKFFRGRTENCNTCMITRSVWASYLIQNSVITLKYKLSLTES